MLKLRCLKFLDRWFGSALVAALPAPSPPPGRFAPAREILVIRPGGIGDAILLIPAIRFLKNKFPGVAIDLLAERRNAGSFALGAEAREVFLYDSPGQLFKVLLRRYDVVIDTEQWHNLSAVVARLVRAPVKIGFATNRRGRMFTHPVPYDLDTAEILSFLCLLQPLDIAEGSQPDTAWLQVPESARQSIASLLPENRDARMLVVFPGASIPEKQWGEERFREVVRWCAEGGLRVVLVGGAEDRQLCDRIATATDATILAGKTSLVETAAVIEQAAVVVSGDSGVLHIAAGLARPTVALFGPSSVAKWGPQGGRHIALRPADCPACSQFGYTPECLHDLRCMRVLAVEEVTGAIAALLGEERAQKMRTREGQNTVS